MAWFWEMLLFLSLTWGSALSSEGGRRSQAPSVPAAVIVGTVYCDTCFRENLSAKTSRFISGALVAVECSDGNSKPGFREEVKTREDGEFRVQLPSSISKHLRRIKGCAVKLINSSDPYCSVASSASSSSSSPIRLKSRKGGEHVFSAGFFSFKPLQEPAVCNQKLVNSKGRRLGKKSLLPPEKDFKFPSLFQNTIPAIPGLAPLPGLPELPPLPQLPPLPHLPGIPGSQIPVPPFNERSEGSSSNGGGSNPSRADFFFPPNPLQPPLLPNPLQPPPLIPNPLQPPPLIPNPLQPPPAPLLPNPFQPPPAPLIPNPLQPPPAPPAPLIPNPFQPPSPPPASLIPNPFQPPPAPPAPFLPLPPIPGLTPSPSPPPPPPPAFPFIPLPPLIPGGPPASPQAVKNSP